MQNGHLLTAGMQIINVPYQHSILLSINQLALEPSLLLVEKCLPQQPEKSKRFLYKRAAAVSRILDPDTAAFSKIIFLIYQNSKIVFSFLQKK